MVFNDGTTETQTRNDTFFKISIEANFGNTVYLSLVCSFQALSIGLGKTATGYLKS